MKRFISVLSVFIVIVCCTLTVFSFNIDGSNDAVEWTDAQSVLLFSNGGSDNKIKFGSLMWAVEGNNLYICFNFIETGLTPDNTNVGVIFSVDDSEFCTVTAAEPAFYDSEKHRIEGALSINSAEGATCEVRIGFKHGIPDTINGKVRFIDTDNSYSDIYDFCLNNKIEDNYYNSYSDDTTKAAKTTTVKATTTKAAKTTKATTTKMPKTTKAPKTTEKADDDSFNLFGFLNHDTTTGKESTKTSTKKKTAKTTKKSTKTVVTSIKIIEKVVEVTENTEHNDTTTEVIAQQNTNVSQSTVTTPQGKKYQMLTVIAGAIALIAVSIIGASGANRKAQKKAGLTNDNEEPEDIDKDSEDKINNE